ncbi:two component transcriptional regulator, LuxR family [Saccharopolyspora kobensis]|uniref:Two component transcriptional regulator, LuxR family n=1 Tax=Saccharopolyspora kobensis TaxID=146035 RepID=A0A1H5U2R1_9PSEU|nr:response regulator transcription factor [Saccharopolyspora kobensis]SEF69309.1 two component transcriptional regulator, LuxR family [Saccharopolyspora kobensis]SFC77992.1 two component transcriptional regulator, LuxR family [Saccharopolyspora kobensis]
MRWDEDSSPWFGDAGAVNVLRLLMVDDHVMLAEALGAKLAERSELWVVGHCATSDPRLSDVVRQAKPDVLTLDVEPAGSAAGRLVTQVQRIRPGTAIVVLTGTREPDQAVAAARAGAAAWVPKERSLDELTEVLLGVCRGRSWYPPDLLGPVLRELREDAVRAGQRDGPLDVLSDRERDVLTGMVNGKRGAQIAAELLISAETVRTHTRSILAKLQVHSQLEAVSVARAAGLRADEPDPAR